jgi:uncharacterized protein YukE
MKADVKMDYGAMEDAKKVFLDGANALEDLITQVKNWATTMNDGALLGDAGEEFANALNTSLCSKIQLLIEKLKEEAGTIEQAVAIMHADEKETAGYFRSK